MDSLGTKLSRCSCGLIHPTASENQDAPAMIDISEVLTMQSDTVAQWHQNPIDNPFEPTHGKEAIQSIACQQHQFNYLLWHEEDIARSPDVSDAQIAQVKRNIDRYNQLRNDWIEKLDDWITEDLERRSIQPLSTAKLNTETPGSAMDRLSILALRIYHLDEQLQRTDVDQSHRDKVMTRLAICRLQRDELSNSLRELLADIYAGLKQHRTYRQFKMYNDPTLNPYLYDRNRTAPSGN